MVMLLQKCPTPQRITVIILYKQFLLELQYTNVSIYQASGIQLFGHTLTLYYAQIWASMCPWDWRELTVLVRFSISKLSVSSILLALIYAIIHFYIDSTKENLKLLLNEEMEELEVLINFSPYANRSDEMNYWFHNIQLFIIYGTYNEIFRSK